MNLISVVSFPNCKINLGLRVLNKRPDGFHNIETVFYPLHVKDALEIIQDISGAGPSINVTGTAFINDTKDNLCLQAYHLLKKDFPTLPSIRIHLHKIIPAGAGLGGGSADAAFTLLLLNKKFNLELPEDLLAAYALRLGSDVPFFLKNIPCFATGRGEKIEPTELDLSAFSLAIIYPGIHVSTGWAFSQLNFSSCQHVSINDVIKLPVTDWKENLYNDFEIPVFEKYPNIKELKTMLYHSGALYASLSGSGSSVFGIFESKPQLADFPPGYFVKII